MWISCDGGKVLVNNQIRGNVLRYIFLLDKVPRGLCMGYYATERCDDEESDNVVEEEG